jgi:hypothetical protein
MDKTDPEISKKVRGEVTRYQLRTPELQGKHYTQRFENIITAYLNANRDIEYHPSLTTLCAPFIYSLERECDAYFCFERLMQAIMDEYDDTNNNNTMKEHVANFMTLFRYVLPDFLVSIHYFYVMYVLIYDNMYIDGITLKRKKWI